MKKKIKNANKKIVKKKPQPVNNNNKNNKKPISINNKINKEVVKIENKSEKGDDFLYVGEFINNEKNGKGIIYYEDGTLIEGNWKDGELNGKGIFKTGELIISGEFIDGELSGQVEEIDKETGKLVFKGEYSQGQRHGRGNLIMIEDGGELAGTWIDGKMTGYAEYTFPTCNGRFKIQGQWLNGDLVSGKYNINYQPLRNEIDGKRLPIDDREREYMRRLEQYQQKEVSKECRNFILKLDESDQSTISTSPLHVDLYERFHCFVGKLSTIPNSGEGLFAKIFIPSGTIISFYNGVRLTHQLVNSRSWSENNNTISLNHETVIDVPPHLNDTVTQYSATISHKANHLVPNNNSVYASFYHPRFGDIKCIKAIKDINENEEIFVDYGYSNNDTPSWYKVK
ncbi:hypothetical protein ACTFIR_001478 [Dictyostelium discoideum]